MPLPQCAIRMSDDDGPWYPCPEPVALVDPDGDALCARHLDLLWSCPECEAFIPAGDATLCAACQAASDALDTEPLP